MLVGLPSGCDLYQKKTTAIPGAGFDVSQREEWIREQDAQYRQHVFFLPCKVTTFCRNLEPQRIADIYKQMWMALFENTLACSFGIIFKVVNLHFSDVLWTKTQAARCHRVVLRAKRMWFRGESKSSTASSKITGGSGFLGLTYFFK